MSGITIGRGDVEKGGEALFEYRKSRANDRDPLYRQPMMYKDYAWKDLPEVARTYHRDMFVQAAALLGIRTVL